MSQPIEPILYDLILVIEPYNYHSCKGCDMQVIQVNHSKLKKR